MLAMAMWRKKCRSANRALKISAKQKLLRNNPLFQPVIRVKQEIKLAGFVLRNLQFHHMGKARMVGGHMDRARFGLQRLQLQARIGGQQRAAPGARPKRRNRRQRQQLGIERQDGTMRRQIIGGAASRAGEQNAIGHQFRDAALPIHRDAQFGGWRIGAPNRDLIDGARLMAAAARIAPAQNQRLEHRAAGGGEPLEQSGFAVAIEQKPDRAEIHAEHCWRRAAGARQQAMQAAQQKAIAAQRHQNIRLGQRDRRIELPHGGECALRRRRGAGEKSEFGHHALLIQDESGLRQAMQTHDKP